MALLPNQELLKMEKIFLMTLELKNSHAGPLQ